MSDTLTVGRVEVQLSFLVGLALAACWCEPEVLLAFLLGAVIHEMGHLLSAWGLGMGFSGLRLSLWGAELVAGNPVSHGREWLILAAGPGANLLFALAVCRWAPLLAGASFLLGMFNLLPVLPLDGGQLVRIALIALLGLDRGTRAEQVLSLLTAAVLCALGAFLLCHGGSWCPMAFALWLGWNGVRALS